MKGKEYIGLSNSQIPDKEEEMRKNEFKYLFKDSFEMRRGILFINECIFSLKRHTRVNPYTFKIDFES